MNSRLNNFELKQHFTLIIRQILFPMINFKKVATKGLNPSIETRELTDFANATGNIYETLVMLSKRSNQISLEMKEELQAKLKEFASSTDNLEEVHENREQIEISRFYERIPHPVLLCVDEMFEGNTYYRLGEKESGQKQQKKR